MAAWSDGEIGDNHGSQEHSQSERCPCSSQSWCGVVARTVNHRSASSPRAGLPRQAHSYLDSELFEGGIPPRRKGLDHGIGHLASMSPQKNERLLPSKGCNEWATSPSLAMITQRRGIDTGGRGGNRPPRQAT